MVGLRLLPCSAKRRSVIEMSTKWKQKWLTVPLAGILIAILALAACAGPTAQEKGATPTPGRLSGSIKIIGSNTVTPLTSVWMEDFMKINTAVNIAVSGPGSGVGIAALIDGTTDIAQSSRSMTAKEIEQAKAKGRSPYETQIATDALSVVVHPSNPVSELTIAQLSAIYTNGITNWKEVGGKDEAIVVLSRDTNSGTHVFFKEHVVQMENLPTQNKALEYGPKVLFLPSTEGGVAETARNPRAISYAGLGYVRDGVKPLAIKKTASGLAVLPSVATALDGTYPIARPLLYYTSGAPMGVVKTFIDYCLSPEGQQKVAQVGYVPLARPK